MPRAKTGGRKKGIKNKKNEKKIRAIESSGLTPLDYLLSVLRDENIDASMRIDASKAAAPYVHQRLSTIEHTGDPNNPMEHKWTVDIVHTSKRAQEGY